MQGEQVGTPMMRAGASEPAWQCLLARADPETRRLALQALSVFVYWQHRQSALPADPSSKAHGYVGNSLWVL